MNLRLAMLSVAFGIGVAQPAWSQRYSLNCEFNSGVGITKYQYIFKGSEMTLGTNIEVKRQINENGYPPGEWETDPSVDIKSEGPFYFIANSKEGGNQLLFIEESRLEDLGLSKDIKFAVLDTFGVQLCKSVSQIN